MDKPKRIASIGWNTWDDCLYVITGFRKFGEIDVTITNKPHVAITAMMNGDDVKVIDHLPSGDEPFARNTRELRPDEILELGRRDQQKEYAGKAVWEIREDRLRHADGPIIEDYGRDED